MMEEISNIEAEIHAKWALFWIFSSVAIIVFFIAWSKNFFSLPKIDSLPKIKGEDVGWGFGFFLVAEILLIPFVIGLTSMLIWGNEYDEMLRKPLTQSWMNLAVIWGGGSAAALAFFKLQPIQRKLLWLPPGPKGVEHFCLGIAAWFVIFPAILAFDQGISLIISKIFHHPFHEQIVVKNLRAAMQHPFLFGWTTLTIVTIVPFTEEFLFRGLLQTWLKQKMRSRIVAIGLSSFVFSLFHFSSQQGFSNIEILSSLFFLSCMLGYVFERENSLWASFGLHSFFNFVSVAMIIYMPEI